MKEKCLKRCIVDGICFENPVFRLLLGLCPTLAVTTSAINGIAIGLAATFVLIGSNLIISMLKNFIPKEVRIPCYIVVIATFVTLTKLIMQAYLPSLYESLGLFIDIMVVNCIILGRAEAFASKNTVFRSLADGLGMGIGFTCATFMIGGLREALGAGTLFGHFILGVSFEPAIVMLLPPGAFLTLGLLIAIFNRLIKGER